MAIRGISGQDAFDGGGNKFKLKLNLRVNRNTKKANKNNAAVPVRMLMAGRQSRCHFHDDTEKNSFCLSY